MKKILTLLVLVSSLFALAACQSTFSNTKVRVVGLSYRTSAEELASVPSNNTMRLLSNKLLADEVEEYIFPGDILTFTVELEDPNFEFISLLSIKFNDNIIRANVDNSIVTTRDCGANICVDFPFELTAQTEYTVQEVKFAKLNSDNGVNAIIDNQSTKKVAIDVYTEEIFPYVIESVQTLNNAIKSMTFWDDGHMFDAQIDPSGSIFLNALYYSRVFYIDNYKDEVKFQKAISSYGTFELDLTGDTTAVQADTWMFYDNYSYNHQITQQTLKQLVMVNCLGELVDSRYDYVASITLTLQHTRYKDTYFYNEGNKIYMNLLGENYILIELKNDMKILYNGFLETLN